MISLHATKLKSSLNWFLEHDYELTASTVPRSQPNSANLMCSWQICSNLMMIFCQYALKLPKKCFHKLNKSMPWRINTVLMEKGAVLPGIRKMYLMKYLLIVNWDDSLYFMTWAEGKSCHMGGFFSPPCDSSSAGISLMPREMCSHLLSHAGMQMCSQWTNGMRDEAFHSELPTPFVWHRSTLQLVVCSHTLTINFLWLVWS